MPPLLTLPLCRFDYDWERGERRKVSSLFPFPTVLDVAPYMAERRDLKDSQQPQPVYPVLYDLLAVVIHSGSAHSGHYHAYICNMFDEAHSKASTAPRDCSQGQPMDASKSHDEGSGIAEVKACPAVEGAKVAGRWYDFNDSIVAPMPK